MKILVLESSGNKNGSSNMLAGEFIRGARENGHEITEFDVIRADIHACLGCRHCGMSGPCVWNDDYENKLKPLIKQTDMIVFVMPVYYYGWPSQMKKVIDRFYSFNAELTAMHKKTVLLSVAWDNTDLSFEEVREYYKKICGYMQFRSCGVITGKSCGMPSVTHDSQYPQMAYELGKSV